MCQSRWGDRERSQSQIALGLARLDEDLHVRAGKTRKVVSINLTVKSKARVDCG